MDGTPTPGQSGPESNRNEGVLHIPPSPRLVPHHQIKFNVIPRTLNSFKYFYLTVIILFIIFSIQQHLHTVKWFQAFLSNTNNSI